MTKQLGRLALPAWLCLALVLTTVITVIAVGPANAGPARADAKKAKSAVDRTIAIYVPESVSDTRIFLPQVGAAFAPGKAIEDAAVDAGNLFFKSASLFNPKSDAAFNVLLVTHAKWESKDNSSVLTIKYKVLDAAGATLAEGEKHDDIGNQKLLENNAFYSMSLGVMKDILSDDGLLGKFTDPHAFTATTTAAAVDPTLLVSREKPVKTGTGFFINDRGQVITAAHVVHDCPVAEIKADGKSTDAKVVAESLLLDLAVIQSGSPAAHFIPLRIGTSFDLGEAVTNVGFPLEGVLAGSPNLTRGNVSSRAALAGSLGQFQFSAPVQPGSSGGPVVSETGELLGVTVGTLGVMGLIQKGVLPQNVNFALDARYVATFMDRNKVRYVSVPPSHPTDTRAATEMTLAAVVQLSCYQ
jgi:serine protease Do